jgi:drug/metabolite transporter (DMT)-like permease
MTNRMNGRALASASLAVLSWSTVATAFKLALEHLTHFELLLIASCTALLIFTLVITVQRKWAPLLQLAKRRWTYYALLGLLNPVAYYLILFKSYSLLPAQVAQPINYVWPILLTVLLALFSHRAIPRVKYIGLFISLCGVAFISLGSNEIEHLHLSAFGLFLAVFSALLWATYWLITDKEKEKADATMSLFLCFFFGSVYLVAAAAVIGIHPITLLGLLSGMYVGGFEMGIPFIAFGYALGKTTNPALINQMCYLAPFLSLFFIAMVLGEPIVVTTFVGLALIVGGILFNQYGVNLKLKKSFYHGHH